jgi:hypothetical protein
MAQDLEYTYGLTYVPQANTAVVLCGSWRYSCTREPFRVRYICIYLGNLDTKFSKVFRIHVY